MDKLIIEFNKKFDKQKQELIDGFKALGEEKRLPKALATIEGEQPTYKNYFKAGWQSRQVEVDFLNAQLGIKRDQINGFESEIKKAWQAVDEKDKRIETLITAWRNQAKELCNVDDKHVREALLSCADELEVMRVNNANS